jgi:hypothetical protein
VFDRTQHNVLQVLRRLHESVSKFCEAIAAEPYKPKSGGGAAAGDTASGDESSGGAAAVGVGGDDSKVGSEERRRDEHEREIDRRKKRRRRLLQIPAAVASTLREEMERSLQLLVPLLNTREYLPESLGFTFADLAHGHLHQLLLFVNSALMCGLLRESEGPIFKSVPPAILSDLPAIADNRYPYFYLYLSFVCTQLEAKEFGRLHKFLKTAFPAPTPVAPAGSSRGGGGGGLSSREPALSALDQGMSDVLNKAKEAAQLLLARYVEAHGWRLSDIIRSNARFSVALADDAKGGGDDATAAAVAAYHKHAPGYVNLLLKRLYEIECELAELFPAPKRPDASSAATKAVASAASDMDRLFAERMGAAAGASGGRAGGAAGGGGGAAAGGAGAAASARDRTLNRDIERLFKEKVKIFHSVRPNRASPLFAILKVRAHCTSAHSAHTHTESDCCTRTRAGEL